MHTTHVLCFNSFPQSRVLFDITMFTETNEEDCIVIFVPQQTAFKYNIQLNKYL